MLATFVGDIVGLSNEFIHVKGKDFVPLFSLQKSALQTT